MASDNMRSIPNQHGKPGTKFFFDLKLFQIRYVNQQLSSPWVSSNKGLYPQNIDTGEGRHAISLTSCLEKAWHGPAVFSVQGVYFRTYMLKSTIVHKRQYERGVQPQSVCPWAAKASREEPSHRVHACRLKRPSHMLRKLLATMERKT